MPRDYKHRAQPATRKKKSSCGVWFFAGVLVGMFVGGLVWLKFNPDGEKKSVAQKPPSPSTEKQAPKPSFEFYDSLPEMEVVIPRDELLPPPKKEEHAAPATESTTTTPAATTTKAAAATEPSTAEGRYVLQIGSFRDRADAERLKAKVALVGVISEIQQVTINNRDTYHRVRSQVYNQSEANELFERLKNNGISPMVVKLGP